MSRKTSAVAVIDDEPDNWQHTEARLQRGTYRSLRAAIGDLLREQLMTGQLTPGKSINIKDVQREFGVGLSAVREALCQLVADGLVIAEDQRGFRAAPVSEQDLEDVTRARVEIETFAIRDAIAHGDVQWEAQIVAEYHKLAQVRRAVGDDRSQIGPAFRIQHKAFHDALTAACTSKWMLRFRGIVHEHSERYRQLALMHIEPTRNILEEHRTIMEATLDRDADRAAELMGAHVRATMETLKQAARP